MRPETKAAGLIFGAYSLISLLRIFADLVAPHNNDLFTSGLYDTLVILIYQILLISLAFALFLMVHRRLFAALENDITEHKRADREGWKDETHRPDETTAAVFANMYRENQSKQ